MEDKTSVAFRPDLQQLVSQMRQQGGDAGGGGAEEPPVGATEVMSGDSIPDFMAGQDAPLDDGTVEMRNPFGDDAEDVAATEVVSGDMLDNFGFDDPNRSQQQAQQAPPPQKPQQSPPAQQQSSAPAQQPQQPASPAQAPPANQQADPPRPPSQQPAQQQPAQQPAGGGVGDFDDMEGPSGPDPGHDGPWKLKTNFGLTYEFPDTKSLKNWMSSREDLQGYELSGDGETFHGLNEWPQINDGGAGGNAPRQQTPSFQQNSPPPQQPPSGPGAGGNFGGMGGGMGQMGGGANQQPAPQPASMGASSASSNAPGKKIQPNEYRPPSRDSKHHGVLWVVALLLTLVAAAIAVQTFGVYDLKGEVLGMPAEEGVQQQAHQGGPVTDESGAAAPDEEEIAEDGVDPKVAEEVDRLIKDARRAVKNNRLQTASEKLQNAKLLEPKRVEIYELLADVYSKMGQEEEAEKAAEKVSSLKASLDGSEEAAVEEANPN